MPDTPRIDFYVVRDGSADAHFRCACRIVEKAYEQGMRAHIYTQDEADTQRMDDLLWTFRDGSFIPHERQSQEQVLCPITLNHAWCPQQSELLINLTAAVPELYKNFERIAEIVGASATQIQNGRQRFRFYKEQGLEPQYHEVN